MKGTILLVMLALLGWNLLGADGVPVAISPGSDAGVAAVGNGCPTFSWSGVAWAQKYRVVVFGVEGEKTRNNGEPALTAQPVLSEDVAGGGYSWTPSLSRGLATGADYAWCVGALDSDGAWAWSATRRFRVEQGTRSALMEEAPAGLQDEKDETTPGATAASAEKNAKSKMKSGDGIARPLGSEGGYSTFYGTNAGANNGSDSYENSFFGSSAGYANTIGFDNVFFGHCAGYCNYSGYYNTFIGQKSGFFNAAGNYNTYVGQKAGYSNNGDYNVFLGYQAGYNETGSNKLYIENGTSLTPLIYGEFNNDLVRINGTLETKITGSNNVLAVTRTDGAQFKLSAMAGSGQIGTTTDHALNFMTNNVKRLTVLVNGSVGIGVTQPSYPLHMASGAYCSAGGVWTNASSLALKQDIAPLNAETAAAALRDLNPVTYAYKADASEKCVGFIAEEVPELVAMNDRKSLSAMDIVAVLTRVAQEQLKTNQELLKEISELKKEILMLKRRSQKDK